MQRYKSKYTGPQMDVAFERALPGGAIDQSMSAKLDWEGLINPEFTVAQAGIGGNHGSVPYAADCWKLISGTVSAAPGGGLVLNGTIRQTLETAAGLDVVASINVTSGTATAAYDDAAKQFDITSSGGTIKRAHLGLTDITDWSKIPVKDRGETLRKCQEQYWDSGYCAEDTQVGGCSGTALSSSVVLANVKFPVSMRTSPSILIYGTSSNTQNVMRSILGGSAALTSPSYRASTSGIVLIVDSGGTPFTTGLSYDFRVVAIADAS